jgi:hypothetical protein
MKFSPSLTLSLLVLTGLGACASEDQTPAPRHHHHRDGAVQAADPAAPAADPLRGGLFISPSGRPFRAGPGEPYPSAIWFQAADANHDGRLSRAEFRAEAEAFFAQLDTNHDGIIDADEIAAYEHAVPEIILGFRPAQGAGGGAPGAGGGGGHHGGHHGGGGGGGGRGGHGGGSGGGAPASGQAADTKPQGAAWFSFLSIPEPVASSDRNLDGHITLDEFRAAADSRFDLLGGDATGFLTMDALPKTPVQQLGRGRGDAS